MRSMKTGLTAILLGTLAFAITAQAPAPASPPPPAAATPATPAKVATPKATVAAVPAVPAVPAKPKAPKTTGAPGTFVGEVIDPACWIINGANGKGHAECAAACAKAGQTLAILEKRTGKVYLLAGERPGDDPNKGVVEYVGQPVLVKGRVFSRGGLLGIQVTSIEPYSAKFAVIGE